MIGFILRKIFGTKQERDIKRLTPIVKKVGEFEPQLMKEKDEQLKERGERLKKCARMGQSLDELLPEAFALVREVAKRTIGMRHFDVQVMGAVVLHQGKIAEMKTGEGKTLVATMPVYLNALLGEGVHVVTVNDYLAKRDSEWMGPIYRFLGLSVGLLQQGMDYKERKKAYGCDVTYGTNNEFGFDYLRDNMVLDKEYKVQRGHFYAIVDEVDSILIDEARTPLIISGPTEETPSLYYTLDRCARALRKDVDYQVDEKARTVALTEGGVRKAESFLRVANLYEPRNIEILHGLIQALRAHNLFYRDRDYILKDGKVVIVDEFTGRLMPNRRYSEGLHQALEAKEGLRIESESQTLATITLQNYFRMYQKLAGMTGTADTEAEEFEKIYGLQVVVIPTHKPMIRVDHPDMIYKTEKEKFKAVCDEIEECYKLGRPVLVGTTSVEKSERLSSMLKERGIPHQVLNAKYHEKEAYIVAQAGRVEAVTIATNMAGRGTDILLGGNPEYLTKSLLQQRGINPGIKKWEEEWESVYKKFLEQAKREHEEVVRLGGLYVIGTERHEARRIDNQLRGRSGRQGDPGSSRFYISLEDDLMRIFGSDKLAGWMDRLGVKEGEPITHPWITKAIEQAQQQVEGYNFDIRKRLLEYDDVMNQQREIIYGERDAIIEEEEMEEHFFQIFEEFVYNLLQDTEEEGFIPAFKRLSSIFGKEIKVGQGWSINEAMEKIKEVASTIYEQKKREFGPSFFNEVQRLIMLNVLDRLWKDHLYTLDVLREGIGLRAYGQRDPLVEYKHEAYFLFENMLQRVREEVVEFVFKARVQAHPLVEKVPVGIGAKKVGRNQPCPCGSGRKYKHCCGK